MVQKSPRKISQTKQQQTKRICDKENGRMHKRTLRNGKFKRVKKRKKTHKGTS